MRIRGLLLFLLLTILLFFLLLKEDPIYERLVADNPVGTCTTPSGMFGLQLQVTADDNTTKLICQDSTTNNTLATNSSSSLSGNKSTISPTSTPRSSSSSSSTPRDTQTPVKIAPQPITGCNPLTTDVDDLCRQQFGIDFGYQTLITNGCDQHQAKALCSRAYKHGFPLYENNSTDCLPFSWTCPFTGITDPRTLTLQPYCQQYFTGSSLETISSLGCPAPNSTRAICSLNRGIKEGA